MYTHTLDLKTGVCSLEADIQFNGDATPGWSSDDVKLSLEESEMLNSILVCVNKMHHRCGGLIKLEVNIK